jgi:hypothetical protein
MKGYPLNHYVVLEGELPSDVSIVLNKWLNEIHSQQLTERVWVYSMLESGEHSGILGLLRAVSPNKGWKPFRLLFLHPHGNGYVSYQMPAVPTSGDGMIGSGGGGF